MKPGSSGDRRIRLAGTRRTRAAAAGVAGTAAAVAVAGLAVPASAAPAAPRPAAVQGAEHFQIMSTNPTANKLNLITYGVVTGAGWDLEPASSNGPTSTATFVLPGGSFKVTHTNPNGGSFDPKTCVFQFAGNGTFKVSGGTGRYRGISGGGTFTLSETGIGLKLKNGTCNPAQNAAPVAAQLVVDASGPVQLP